MLVRGVATPSIDVCRNRPAVRGEGGPSYLNQQIRMVRVEWIALETVRIYMNVYIHTYIRCKSFIVSEYTTLCYVYVALCYVYVAVYCNYCVVWRYKLYVIDYTLCITYFTLLQDTYNVLYFTYCKCDILHIMKYFF